MIGYRICRNCRIKVATPHHCNRCGLCRKTIGEDLLLRPGCCTCPSDRRPIGPKMPIGGGRTISSGSSDGPAVPILEDPYAG